MDYDDDNEYYWTDLKDRPFPNKPVNFELLKDAVAIIAGIPARNFNLNNICERKGETLSCGTIACAAGWLSLHPTFAKKLKPQISSDSSYPEITWNTKLHGRTDYYPDAMAELFNIPNLVAEDLFDRSYSYFGCGTGADHKKEFRNRIVKFLKLNNKLTPKTKGAK